MDFHKLILAEPYSTQKIVAIIKSDKRKVKQLFAVFFEDNPNSRLNQRASCVLEVIAKQQPTLIETYLPRLVSTLTLNLPDRYIRNCLRVLQHIKLPVSLLGKATNSCFYLLADKNQPVGIHVFSMTVLLNICEVEPDLKNELQVLIETQIEYAKPAFKSRGKKTLLLLNKPV